METCITPFPEVKSASEVAGGALKKFPDRLFAVPPRVANSMVPGVTVESYQKDIKLWKKRVTYYKNINRLLGTTRYRNIMDMNAGLGGFAAALDSSKLWVMNVVPTIAQNTLGVIYERGLIGMYHDWYLFHFCFIVFLFSSRKAKVMIHSYCFPETYSGAKDSLLIRGHMISFMLMVYSAYTRTSKIFLIFISCVLMAILG